ncbi:MAG: hypothetical protein ACYC2I_04215 [Elusimicrobiales bacterium]
MTRVVIAVAVMMSGLNVMAVAEEARPIAVDIRFEGAAGELSDKAAAISKALSVGDNADAEQLLADLYSGGVRLERAAPVRGAKCCHCGQQDSVTAVAASSVSVPAPAPATPIAAAPSDPFANDPITQYLKAEEAKKAEADAKAKEKEDEAEENARKQREFNWGVTIMTIALLLLLL